MERGQPCLLEGAEVLVDKDLHKLIEEGAIKVVSKTVSLRDCVQTVSLDLPCGPVAYKMPHMMRVPEATIRETVDEASTESIDLSGDGAVLQRGGVYFIPCGEVALPIGYSGSLAIKASPGRVDTTVRGCVDRNLMYDEILPESTVVNQELWFLVTPRSFNVRVKDGIALTQLVIFKPPAEVPVECPRDVVPTVYDTKGKPAEPMVHEGNLCLSLPAPVGEVPQLIGYAAVDTEEVLDLTRENNDPSKFFEEVRACHGRLELKRDRFYVMSTYERISIPQSLSGVVLPSARKFGKIRVNYGGHFDPGFGGVPGGAAATLNIRPWEDVALYPGQPVCMVRFARNSGAVLRPHSKATSQNGPQLPCYFRRGGVAEP